MLAMEFGMAGSVEAGLPIIRRGVGTIISANVWFTLAFGRNVYIGLDLQSMRIILAVSKAWFR